MPATIRLTRMGRKKRPFYRLVVLDSRKRRDGAYLANLGYYNPFSDPFEVELHDDEIISWLQKGATISETARSLLQGQGLLYKYSLINQGMPADEVAAKVAQWRDQAEQNRVQKLDAAAARKAEAEKKAAEEAAAKAKAEAEAKAAEEAAAKAAAAAEAKAAADAAAEAADAAAEGGDEAAPEAAEAEDSDQ
ncbi:MAG: 30S ribosomal protein S16 [bacterium]